MIARFTAPLVRLYRDRRRLGRPRRKEIVMKSLTSLLLAIAALSVAVGATSATAPPTRVKVSNGRAINRPPSVFYGHIKAMSRKGTRFGIRFDPAWWLTGNAAEQAKFEDTGRRDVPNDYYVVEEGHRLLSFVVAANARVTVLTGGGAQRTLVRASELNQIVNGKNPRHRHLSEPRAGFWIRIGEKYPNPAVSLDQQYQP
jgi:hypothetical protein